MLARQSCFSRAAAGRSTEVQIVAANIDTVLIVTSCNRDFNLRRIERYLALAWESGARPVVVLNKADLDDGDRDRWYADIAAIVQGVPVAITSAVRGDGLADLREIVGSSGTTALLGSSGVGKSTLINALIGDSRQEVLPIRDSDDRGRHSTTARQLFCLPGGGVLIDTPGMRELQLWDAEEGLEQTFADVESLATACRFRDCSHGAEPGCAVVAAAERGELRGRASRQLSPAAPGGRVPAVAGTTSVRSRSERDSPGRDPRPRDSSTSCGGAEGADAAAQRNGGVSGTATCGCATQRGCQARRVSSTPDTSSAAGCRH